MSRIYHKSADCKSTYWLSNPMRPIRVSRFLFSRERKWRFYQSRWIINENLQQKLKKRKEFWRSNSCNIIFARSAASEKKSRVYFENYWRQGTNGWIFKWLIVLRASYFPASGFSRLLRRDFPDYSFAGILTETAGRMIQSAGEKPREMEFPRDARNTPCFGLPLENFPLANGLRLNGRVIGELPRLSRASRSRQRSIRVYTHARAQHV